MVADSPDVFEVLANGVVGSDVLNSSCVARLHAIHTQFETGKKLMILVRHGVDVTWREHC